MRRFPAFWCVAIRVYWNPSLVTEELALLPLKKSHVRRSPWPCFPTPMLLVSGDWFHRCKSLLLLQQFRKQRRLSSRNVVFPSWKPLLFLRWSLYVSVTSIASVGRYSFFQNCKRCCECERCIWWYRCPACFKQFSSKQILIQHLEKVGHSRHDPQCGSCHKHCFCFESLREHLLGNSFVLFLKTLCWRLKSWSRGCLGYWMYVMTTSTPYVIIWY